MNELLIAISIWCQPMKDVKKCRDEIIYCLKSKNVLTQDPLAATPGQVMECFKIQQTCNSKVCPVPKKEK